MLPIHLAIGLVEGLITAAVLNYVYEVRPQLLWGAEKDSSLAGRPARLSLKKMLLILGLAAALTGGVLSLYASAVPDGLEWSMEKVAGTSELEAEGKVYQIFSGIQEKTSILPDYGFADGESAAGTTISGIAGSLFVAALCIGAGAVLGKKRAKR